MRWTPEQKQCVERLFDVHGSQWVKITAEYAKKYPARSKESIRSFLRDTGYNSKTKKATQTTSEYEELKGENEQLKQEIARLHSNRAIIFHNYDQQWLRFGVVSDTQLGSYYQCLEGLEHAYDVFAKEGIKYVYHAGDLIDGEKMYRGHEYEIFVHGADMQCDYAINHYPQRDGIETHFICGNHDGSFYKHSGIDIGFRLAEKRSDMIYHGPDEADIQLTDGENTVTLRLFHPGGGTAYALSYRVQKYIESLTGGEKPHIILSGHTHKQEMLFYRNIHAVQTGCLQFQTPFLRRKNIAAVMGFHLIEICLAENTVYRFKAEWIPIYSGSKE